MKNKIVKRDKAFLGCIIGAVGGVIGSAIGAAKRKKAEEKADILTGMIVCTMRNLETE